MKKTQYNIFFAFLAIFLISNSCVEDNPTDPSELTIDVSSLDYGNNQANNKISKFINVSSSSNISKGYSLKITGDGKDAFHIIGDKSISVSKEESDKIEIEFDYHLRGEYKAVLEIGDEYSVPLKGTIYQIERVEINTNSIDFGTLFCEEDSLISLEVTNITNENIDLNLRFDMEDNIFSLPKGNTLSLDANSSDIIPIKVFSDQKGFYQNTLRIDTLVFCQLIADFQNKVLIPDNTELFFGSIELDEKKTMSLLLTNQTNADLSISKDDISGHNDIFSIKKYPDETIAAHSSTEMIIEFAPANAQYYETTLYFNDKVMSNVRLTAYGSLYDMSLTHTEVDFGSVKVGSNESEEITLTNNTNYFINLRYRIVGEDASEFSSDINEEFVLDPQAQYKFNVTFSPTQESNTKKNAIFEIFGANEYVKQVYISGKAIK